MLYMVIERFKNRDAKAVYRRFRESGRMMPDGLGYVASWVETSHDRCFQGAAGEQGRGAEVGQDVAGGRVLAQLHGGGHPVEPRRPAGGGRRPCRSRRR